MAGDQGATQLLVALLQLELLSARLPCMLRRPLCALGLAMQHRSAPLLRPASGHKQKCCLLTRPPLCMLCSADTGPALRTALEAAVLDGKKAGAGQLLQLLSSSLATLRALVVAERRELAFAGVPSERRRQAQQDCVRQLIQLEGGGAGPVPGQGGQELACLQLLWSLALRNESAGCPVHRKAAILLHWCLAPGLPHLAAMLAQPAVRSLAALGGVQQLAASPYRMVRRCSTAAARLPRWSQQLAA